MSSRFLFITLAVTLTVFSSCKEEETTEKDYLDGDIELVFPEFLHPGDVLKFDVDTMSTLVRTDGDSKKIGYYFEDSFDSLRDTIRLSDGTVVLKEYTFVVPDTLTTLTLSCSGFSDDHYNSISSQAYTVIRDGLNGNSSMTNFDIAATDSTFTDARDGKQYYYTTIGGVDWMRQNLAWEGAGKPYRNSPATTNLFGRYYTHPEALAACPEGWTLPSEADWVKLGRDLGSDALEGEIFPDIAGKLMENVYFNSERMWEYWPVVTIDNAARFSAIPVGYAQYNGDDVSFEEYGRYAMFWCSDTVGSQAMLRFLYEDRTGLYYGLLEAKETALSVRCIRK